MNWRLTLEHKVLKAKQRALRDGFPEAIGLRVHRALSWLGRAEAEDNDGDVQFVLLWIAFNSAYADFAHRGNRADDGLSERDAFHSFFVKLISLDTNNRIYDVVWQRFSGPIRLLMQNHYVFEPFWKHQNGFPGFEDWEIRFKNSSRSFASAMTERDTARLLSFVFDRLYVLRNQIMHGGSTWNSQVNRDQVRDGAAILSFLVPIFIDMMMERPHEDWGQPLYPVVDDAVMAAQ